MSPTLNLTSHIHVRTSPDIPLARRSPSPISNILLVWLASPSLMVNAGGAEGKGQSSIHSD